MDLSPVVLGSALTLIAQIVTDLLRRHSDGEQWSYRTHRAEITRALETILQRLTSIQEALQACKFSDPIPPSLHHDTGEIAVMAAFIRESRDRENLETLAEVIWWCDEMAELDEGSDSMSTQRRAHLLALEAITAIRDMAGCLLREEPCSEPAQLKHWEARLDEAKMRKSALQRIEPDSLPSQPTFP